ncbi:hypothetical protein ASG31_15475 [Chryseobacterium sp. Leaf404]|nr:hypothetical protein ASG31_15475 [Chryseobacterium sp. Leaf404]
MESTVNQDKTEVGKLSLSRISLSERTRGTNRLFTITPNKTETDINGNISSKTVTAEEWKAISGEINKINLDEISSYKSPTTKRYSDAALASVMVIEKDGKTYTSEEFDAGNPPQELKNLYQSFQTAAGIKKGGK